MRSIFSPRPLAAEAQVGFKDLTNVHTRRYAQRVEDDVDRRAIGHRAACLQRA